jgi:hypothetical protein
MDTTSYTSKEINVASGYVLRISTHEETESQY